MTPSHDAAAVLRPNVLIDRCEVDTVETPYDHSVHAYHRVTPWSPDGTRLLYYGVDSGTDHGHVVVRDLESGDDTVVGRSESRNFHVAAGQRWCFGGEAVVYDDVATLHDEGPGTLHVVDVDDPDSERTLDELTGFGLWRVCSDGLHIVGTMTNATGTDEIVRANLDTQATETLVTMSESLDQVPSNLRDPDATYRFKHTVPNNEETRLFYKIVRDPPYDESDGRHPWLVGSKFCAFLVKDLESGEVKVLSDRISGHPFWMADGRHILNVKYPYDGSQNRWLVLHDAKTGTDERVVDQPFEGPGHPAQSPDGRWIATNGLTADGDAAPIYVVDLERGACREIIRLDNRFAGGDSLGSVAGAQPHPVWSPDGRELLVKNNAGGERMELLRLTSFLP